MAIGVTHLNTKSADDPMDPSSTDCPKNQAQYGFLRFFNNFFVAPSNDVTFLCTSPGLRFPLEVRHNCTKFGAGLQRGSRFPKEYLQFRKKCFLSNSVFPFRKKDPVLQMPKFHWFTPGSNIQL